MNDESDIPERKNEDSGPLAGQRLAEARKAREVSIFDIAKELHLDEFKVQALEENRFDVLGAPVFAKGHLRKYAELVGVSVDDMMADYATLNRAAGAPPVVGRPRKQARDWNFGPWLLAVVFLLIVLAVAYWWLGRVPAPDGRIAPPASSEGLSESTLPQPAEAPVAEALPAAAPPAAEVAAPESSPSEPAAEAGADVEAPPAAAQDAVRAPAPASAGNTVRLSMTFSGDCWTEVSDATGARLFFDLGREGRTLNVSGEAPLRVLFGNSDNVAVTVDGRSYAITPAMRRGQTARLTISKP